MNMVTAGTTPTEHIITITNTISDDGMSSLQSVLATPLNALPSPGIHEQLVYSYHYK